MGLDVNTLFLVTIYVEAMLGLLLLFAWIQNSGIHAVAWWGCAHLLRAASVVLFGMYGTVSDAISIDLANAMLFTAFAVTWSGARVFDGRAPEPMYLVGGAVLWILVCRTPRPSSTRSTPRCCSPPASSPPTPGRRLMSSGAAAASRWCRAGPRSSCCSRMARCSCCARRSSQVLPWSPTNQVFDSVWLTVLSFEALLFTIAIAFILLAMAKERTELRHKTAALVDPLTGIANRRAFLEEVIALSKRQEAEGRPVAVLLADLDHFKSINDRFGHAVGDQRAADFRRGRQRQARPLRPDRPARRRGVRHRDLRRRPRQRPGDRRAHPARRSRPPRPRSTAAPIGGTVSMGMAIAETNLFDIPALLAQADEALYCAKERGRNRVEVASLQLVLDRAERGRAAPAHAARSAAPGGGAQRSLTLPLSA